LGCFQPLKQGIDLKSHCCGTPHTRLMKPRTDACLLVKTSWFVLLSQAWQPNTP
jgi:hypothetical protein